MVTFLRAHRRRAGLTLEALAERTGLTKSYLSKVERGISTPSIAAALGIARALDADVGQLFSDGLDGETMTVERHDERLPAADAGAAVYDAIAARMIGKAMQPFVVHPTTEDGTDFMEHPGEEFVFVTEGTVDVSLPDRVITLHRGDSLYFDANTPHRMRSTSPHRAALLVVVHDAQSTPGAGTASAQRRCGPSVRTV
ncbi:helix-turn-helix domain-containing protein [Prescottella subtropica]|uniref:helix-turn-helix domain-containing protein n=1 Tax=Prescottella subtropica TaxID=2545757 RepID=UPI0010F5D0BB|nr:XRE family transcriptional regulator [Prescottella subtropica]